MFYFHLFLFYWWHSCSQPSMFCFDFFNSIRSIHAAGFPSLLMWKIIYIRCQIWLFELDFFSGFFMCIISLTSFMCWWCNLKLGTRSHGFGGYDHVVFGSSCSIPSLSHVWDSVCLFHHSEEHEAFCHIEECVHWFCLFFVIHNFHVLWDLDSVAYNHIKKVYHWETFMRSRPFFNPQWQLLA